MGAHTLILTLHDRLQDIFQTVFNDDGLELRDDMGAADVPGWDSVAHINLMFSIEEAFGVSFAGNELAEFTNVGELKRYLESKTAGHRAA
jgi:acyl carrier protein